MGKNQSASGLTNIIQYDNKGNVSFVSGSTTLMQISSSGAITTTGVISGSNALSASYSLNSGLLNSTGSVGFATTASLLTVSSSQQQISASQQQLSSSFLILTASYTALSSSYTALSGSYNTFSGSNSEILTAVSSSNQQLSASYTALSGSYNTFSGSASTRITVDSASLLQVSSSQQQISASLLNVISIFATTGSNSFRATQSITGSLTVTGQIIAQTLNVQQVTSSIIYSSGSNNFGCDLNSRQTFTGSVLITGSLTNTGALTSTGATCFVGNAIVSTAGNTTLTINGTSGVPALSFTNTGGTNNIYGGVGSVANITIAPGDVNAVKVFAVGCVSCFAGAATFNGNVTVTNNNWLNFTDSTATARNILTLAGNDNLYLQYKAGCNFYLRNTDGDLRLTIASTGAATFSSTITGTTIYGSTAVCSAVGKFTSCVDVGSITMGGNGDIISASSNSGFLTIGSTQPIRFTNTASSEWMRITSAGIACFACQVCAPSFKGGTINGTIGSFSCHVEITDNGMGWIYGQDKNHSIIMRGDRNGCVADYTNYYQYGGNLSTCKGHNFWTDGVLASQTIKMQIANNGICMTVPLYVCNTITAANYRTITNQATIPSSCTSTILTLSSSAVGVYIVQGNFGGQGNTAYGSTLIVVANSGAFRIVTNGSASNSCLTLSGANVQIQNVLGISLDAYASAILIGN